MKKYIEDEKFDGEMKWFDSRLKMIKDITGENPEILKIAGEYDREFTLILEKNKIKAEEKEKLETEKKRKEQEAFEYSLSDAQSMIYKKWGGYPNERVLVENETRWTYVAETEEMLETGIFYYYFFDGAGKLIREKTQEFDLFLPIYYEGELIGYVLPQDNNRPIYDKDKNRIGYFEDCRFLGEKISSTKTGDVEIWPNGESVPLHVAHYTSFKYTSYTTCRITFYPETREKNLSNSRDYDFRTTPLSLYLKRAEFMGWTANYEHHILESLAQGALYLVILK